MNQQPAPPSVFDLTRAQTSGWACVWCSSPLTTGAVSAGRAPGQMGAHDLSVEVYACDSCARNGVPIRTPDEQGDAE